MAPSRRDELRNEGKKKQSRLGIENFGENSLAKSAPRGLIRAHGHFFVSRADHSDAEPQQIRGARVLDRVKRRGRGGQDRGNPQRGGKDVEEPAGKSPIGR